MTTIQQALNQAAHSLASLDHSSPDLEAAVLLCHQLGKPRSYLLAWPEQELSAQALAGYRALLERRLEGEPIAHITGVREFWSLTLKITPDTLIPRPETELLVERALEHLRGIDSPHVADLGTGSGAIALAIASERPDASVVATDQSAAALEVAQENRHTLGLSNVELRQGDWLQALPPDAVYDLILSNPPYIAEQDTHLHQGDLPREPTGALASGTDGLNDIRGIVSGAMDHLKPGGWLLLEHGYGQGPVVRELLHQAGFLAIQTLRDLSGHERMSEGRRPA